ncbi:MAG: nucleotide exchange factor GrpE [Sphaerochaeta sp.]|nr:nucleotide exchange factor GrpE [Sphaerochaeta sp.]
METKQDKKSKKEQPEVEDASKVMQDEPKVLPEMEQKDLEIAQLKEQLESAQSEIASLKDQMLRDRADSDNFRKRVIRDKDDAVKYANSNLIKDLLQPLDDFDRAISAAESAQDFTKIHDGVVMVNSQLYGMLERNWGLSKIEALGKEFNPEEHEACMVVDDESLDVETVLEEFSVGYKLHGRVIRPSKVKVGKPNI